MRNRCNFARWGIVLLASLFLSGCAFAPSNSEVERALVRGDPLIGKIYLIRNVRRLNGYERQEGYVVEFDAEIHILETPVEYFRQLAKGDQTSSGVLTTLALVGGGIAKWGPGTVAAISTAKKNDVIPFSGSVTMIKSEQGWISRPD